MPWPRDRRYVAFWKLEDLLQTGQLDLRRADKLDDEGEGLPGLPPAEYERVLNLSRYDLRDRRERDNDIGCVAVSSSLLRELLAPAH